jgi:hypothetical protein
MLTGLELMLKRMETHPEEFAGVNGGCSKEWYSIVLPVIEHLTNEEKKAFERGLKQAYRDHFNGQVLRKLAGEQALEEGTTLLVGDYYGGSSLFERLNGTASSDRRAMMNNRVVAKGNYSLYESAKSTQAATEGEKHE